MCDRTPLEFFKLSNKKYFYILVSFIILSYLQERKNNFNNIPFNEFCDCLTEADGD